MINKISVIELKKVCESKKHFTLLDVRTSIEVSKAKIAINSIHIPMNEIPIKMSDLNKNDDIIVYCKSGVRSKKVCDYLIDNNFKNIRNLEGGILAWANEIDHSLLNKLF